MVFELSWSGGRLDFWLPRGQDAHMRCLLLLLLAFAGCAVAPPRADRPSTAKGEVLMETDRAFAAMATHDGTAAAFHAYAAADALMMPAGAQPVRGREEIRKALGDGPPGQLLWTPKEARLSREGDLGFTWGTYESHSPSSVHYGKYVTIWKRQPDGTWKFIVDIGNSMPAPTGTSR